MFCKFFTRKKINESHNLNNDLHVTILQNNIKTAATRSYHENKWICKLKALAPHGLNTELVIMLKKCTISTNSVTNSAISFDIMF